MRTEENDEYRTHGYRPLRTIDPKIKNNFLDVARFPFLLANCGNRLKSVVRLSCADHYVLSPGTHQPPISLQARL